MRWKFFVAAAAVMTVVMGGYVGAAGAATVTKYVPNELFRDGYSGFTPEDGYTQPNLWFREDTRTGGGVGLTRPDRTDEPCRPLDGEVVPEGFTYGTTNLALSTNNTSTAKAQLINHTDEVVGTPLDSVTDLGYWTRQCLGNGPVEANASYQLQIDFNGAAEGGFTNLVFEPYYNDSPNEPEVEGFPSNPSDPDQPIAPGVWQFWNAEEGNWWTSRQITCGDFTMAAGAGGAPFDQPADIGAACPDAVVLGWGVNVGSGNQNYVVAVDGITFADANDTVTADFGTAPK